MIKLKTFNFMNTHGETIVEVLLAITVAAFSLGTSYAIANRSLQKSISARERNESTNIIQSQIAALKVREQNTDPTTFSQYFEAKSTIPANFLHFCLDTTAQSKTQPNWPPISNTGQITATTSLSTSGNPSYANGCTNTPQGSPTKYYIDIIAMQTSISALATPSTVYQINVRWPSFDSSNNSQASVYYRF